MAVKELALQFINNINFLRKAVINVRVGRVDIIKRCV